MTVRNYQIEAHPTAATLYVSGHLWLEDEPTLRVRCSMLPARIQWLRIDARALDAADFETRTVLRGVIRHWRAERAGGLMLYATERCILAEPPVRGRAFRRDVHSLITGGAA